MTIPDKNQSSEFYPLHEFATLMNYFGDVPEAEIRRINHAAENERQTDKWLAVKRKRSSH